MTVAQAEPWQARLRHAFPVLLPLNVAILVTLFVGSNWSAIENLTFMGGLFACLGGSFLLMQGHRRTGWSIAGPGLCACVAVALVLLVRAV